MRPVSFLQKLNSIGFVWSVRNQPKVPWKTKFKELEDYKRENGDCMVPQRYRKNVQLGTWYGKDV